MLWSLALLPALGGAAVLTAGPRGRAGLAAAGCAVLAVTLALAVFGWREGWGGHLAWSSTLALSAALPPAAALTAILVPVVALPVVLHAAAHEDKPALRRLVGLLLVFVGGMELLVIAADFLTLLIGWELVGACSWALIGHSWRDPEGPASGRYAFVVTRFGDLGLFLAAMATFAATGSFRYEAVASLEGPPLSVAAFGILLSAAAKSGQVPFSPWLFRAMAGPTPVSALLHAATMVAAGAYLLIRLAPDLSQAGGFGGAVIGVGLVTALAGGVVACLQNHAKKLLAASTSAHYGLMFVAVGAGYPRVALLHLVAHAAFKALLFLAAGSAGAHAGTFALHRLRMGRALPVLAILNAVGALALAGVPPLGAAWTKEAIVTAAGHIAPWLAVAVMAVGGLSAAYATRLHLLAYGGGESGHPASAGERIAVAFLAALTLVLSVLWLPSVHAGAPAFKAWEVTGSLLAVALGILGGALLAYRRPRLGSTGTAAASADWLGLPDLLNRAVTRPFARVTFLAAAVDDRVLDRLPRGAAAAARRLAGTLSAADGRAVDRGVEASARFARALARLGDRLGEAVTDGLPEGTARLAAVGGAWSRRLQTGLSHHYYALLSGGAVILILTLVVLS